MIGGADNSFRFHPLDDAGGAIVTYLQVALHEACRRFTLTAYDGDSLSIERVAGTALIFVSEHVEQAAIVLRNPIDVVGFLTRLEEGHDALYLLV
jgi:hypothetical protein